MTQRSSIGLTKTTKERLDINKAPGQCYEGFICQLVDLWEKVKESKPDFLLSTNKGGDTWKKLNNHNKSNEKVEKGEIYDR